ncbi:MAG: hypothetical protein J6O49_14620, partial [Bacteroidaceae bacterium]|nr:hypothetical protein [Bacteroidaceae bacterium]
FSMSIIIFMLFCLTRPLEGRRTFGDTPRTEGLMRRVYGSDPHFIMENPSHPEYGVDNNVQRNAITFWGALPSYMKDLFLSAFSRESIDHPGKRPTELNWIQTLVRFRSEILRCRCGADVLTENGASTVCGKCASKLSVPFLLRFSNSQYSIPGLPGSRVYRCQIGPCNADDALKPVGKVLAKQSDISVLGLRNLTDKHWDAETPSGKSRKVIPREVVPMKKGIKISIENETITIDEP